MKCNLYRDSRDGKKSLAYGVQQGMGAFRQKHPKRVTIEDLLPRDEQTTCAQPNLEN